MTNEEVLQAINGVLSSTLNYDDSIEYQLTIDDIEWVDKALKPIEGGYDNGFLICPQCGYILCFDKANRAVFQTLHVFERCLHCNQKNRLEG